MSTRAQKKRNRKTANGIPTLSSQNLDLKAVYPVNESQEDVFDYYDDGDHIFLLGCAGTGKTYITFYLALKEILDMRTPRNRLIVIRSTQPSKAQGFLPGDAQQKAAIYEMPYKGICSDLFHRDDAYEVLKKKKIVDFQTTSYLRGTTMEDAIILVDEVQNLSEQEWFTVLTRVGENSRVVICGDVEQDDLTSERFNEVSGCANLIKVLQKMDCMQFVDFGVEDIVRSGFVKELLIAKHELRI